MPRFTFGPFKKVVNHACLLPTQLMLLKWLSHIRHLSLLIFSMFVSKKMPKKDWLIGFVDWVLSSRTDKGNIYRQQGSCIPAHHILSVQGDPLVVKPGKRMQVTCMEDEKPNNCSLECDVTKFNCTHCLGQWLSISCINSHWTGKLIHSNFVA